MVNNFEQWQKKHEKVHPDTKDRIKQRVDKSMDMYEFIGEIVELYVPKVLGYMNLFLGGRPQVKQ